MKVHPPRSPILDLIADFTLAACKVLFWHSPSQSWPRDIRGGSTFILRFQSGLVGVTAGHVVAAYRDARIRDDRLICQLGTSEIDLNKALISLDTELDIATFSISEQHAASVGIAVLDCTREWPPPLNANAPVSLVGFPENIRRQLNLPMQVEFAAYGALAAIEAVTARDLIITYDPNREIPLARAPELPPRRYNMSGCSGGLVLQHDFSKALYRSYPVGVIIGGPGESESGMDVDMIVARRLDLLRSDGTISRPNEGWLPP